MTTHTSHSPSPRSCQPLSLEPVCRGGGGELAAVDGQGPGWYGEGKVTAGSSACTTVAMKHPGAVSEFEAALLDLSHGTQQTSVATCTCHHLVTTALSRCLQRRCQLCSGWNGTLWKGPPYSWVPPGLKTTSTPVSLSGERFVGFSFFSENLSTTSNF